MSGSGPAGDPASGAIVAGEMVAGETVPAELDLRGEVCPFTFVRTRLLLESLALGDTLRVLLDHEPALRNIPRSAVAWGQQVLRTEVVQPGLWAITIRKQVQ